MDFNMARVSLVWVDSTMGSVGTTMCLWCLVDDNVLDDELFDFKTLCFSVGLCVLEQI